MVGQLSCRNVAREKSQALTEEEEQVMWRMVLEQENPKSLNYTVFFLFGQHFATRGRQEHHQIQIEDLKNRSETQQES